MTNILDVKITNTTLIELKAAIDWFITSYSADINNSNSNNENFDLRIRIERISFDGIVNLINAISTQFNTRATWDFNYNK